MTSPVQDLRYAVRTLLGRPGLALAAVLTLGPGLGGAIVVFGLVNLLHWLPLPVARPDEVVEVFTANPQGPWGAWGPTSYPDYLDYREAGSSLAGLAASTVQTVELEAGETGGPVSAGVVSGDYFEVLGVGAALGRTLGPEDDRADAAPAVVLTHGLWQRLFAAEAAALGRTVRLDGHPFTVVGVVRGGFAGTRAGARRELFLPLAHLPLVAGGNRAWLTDRERLRFDLLGRLGPGASLDVVAAQLGARAATLDRDHPLPDLERRVTVLGARRLHPSERSALAPTVRLLAAAMGLLLLIACANVTQLLLARAVGRVREMGIRRALGASAARLWHPALAESCLLALLGALLGLFLAYWARSFLAAQIGEQLARELRFGPRVLGLGLATCLVATLLCALAPALLQVRGDLAAALRSGGTGRAAGGPRLAPLLVGAQVALSALLLATTGLVGRSLWNLAHADPGFATDHLVYATIWARPKRLPDLGRDLYRRAAASAAALSGVRNVGRAQLLPPVASDLSTRFRLPGAAEGGTSRFNAVDSGYFAALGLPLRSGRVFDGRDAAGGPGVVVVSQALADELWPQGDAVGRTIRLERQRPWEPDPVHTVIGVVGSSRQHRPGRAAEPILYLSYEQHYRPILQLALTTEGDPAPVMAALRAEMLQLDPQLETLEIRTYEDHVRESLERERLLTQALATFAFLGWFLAVVGVAGVMSYAVSRQVRDIGVRMALGARGRDVLVQVLGRALRLTAAGLAVGLAGSWAVAHLLRHQLFGVAAGDQAVLAAVSVAILGAAAVAAYVPARRASRVDPLQALRQE